MARRVRLEDAGNLYHVINRGNYRRDVFETEGAKEAFADTLDEGCRRYGWVVHAYVIMRNHFHLALETPEPNLADGMHWLGGTFATRFNRYRKERGHLFQGRYQSLLIEDAAALARVGAYVHLNPVRAQVVGPGEVASFRWSSLFRFVGTEARPPWLQARDLLRPLGGADDSAGWKTYIGYLAAIAEDEEAQERMEFSRMSKGWAIGTAGWRRAVAKELGAACSRGRALGERTAGTQGAEMAVDSRPRTCPEEAQPRGRRRSSCERTVEKGGGTPATERGWGAIPLDCGAPWNGQRSRGTCVRAPICSGM
jgi:putative transposase